MMIQRMKKGMIAAALAVMGCLYFTTAAYAAGSVTVTADKETAVVGENIRITVEATDPSDGAEAPEISVEYDPNRLAYLNCDATCDGGAGGLLKLTDTKANIDFSVLSGGMATVNVSAILGGDGADVQSGSVSVSVEGEDTAAGMGAEAMPIATGVEAGTIMSADGTKVVSTVFPDEFMPPSFTKITTTYQGQQTEAAQFNDVVLLYMTNADGSNGGFYRYDETTGEISDFVSINGIEGKFIIMLPAGAVPVPEGFTKAKLKWGEDKELEAYMVTEDALTSADESEADSAISGMGLSSSEFFLVYAENADGNKYWYMYDTVEGTFQRYLPIASSKSEKSGLASLMSGASDSEDEGNGSIAKLIIIGVLALIIVIMAIIMLNMFLKLRDYQSYDYIDEDDIEEEEEEDEEDEEERETLERPVEKNIARTKESERTYRKQIRAVEKQIEDEFEGDDDLEILEDEEMTEGETVEPKKKSIKKSAAKELTKEEKRELKEQQKAEKARRKHMGDFEAAGSIDWSEMESQMKNTDDERRPRGNNPEMLPKQYREEASENKEQQQRPQAHEPQSTQAAQLQRHNETRPQPQRPNEMRPKPQRVQSPQASRQVQIPGQGMGRAAGMPRQQSYPQMPQQQMPQQQMPQQQMPKQQMPSQMYQQMPPQPREYDFDDDFEFEFLNLDE